MKKIILLTIPFMLVGCEVPSSEPQQKNLQAEVAKQAANSIRFSDNAEIENIKKRVELTSSSGLIGYVTIINKVGQSILYTPVKGKITSGSKRLTEPYKKISIDKGEWTGEEVVDSTSDEGTYGSSNPYVYFWAPGGQYFQTSMDYIYSDKPYRLKEAPLIDLGKQEDAK